jgi:hypothetical protein
MHAQQTLPTRPLPGSTHYYVFVTATTPMITACDKNPQTVDFVHVRSYTRRVHFAGKSATPTTVAAQNNAPWNTHQHFYAVTQNATTRQACYRAFEALQQTESKKQQRLRSLQFFNDKSELGATQTTQALKLHQIALPQSTQSVDLATAANALLQSPTPPPSKSAFCARTTINDVVSRRSSPPPPPPPPSQKGCN